MVLDGRPQATTLTLRLRPGPTVFVPAGGRGDHGPSPGPGSPWSREGSTLPPPWSTDPPDDPTIGAGSRSGTCPRAPTRWTATAGPARRARIRGRAEGEEAGRLRGRRPGRPGRDGRAGAAQAEIERRWGWVATGTVVDESGRPVADAEVAQSRPAGARSWAGARPHRSGRAIHPAVRRGVDEPRRGQRPGRRLHGQEGRRHREVEVAAGRPPDGPADARRPFPPRHRPRQGHPQGPAVSRSTSSWPSPLSSKSSCAARSIPRSPSSASIRGMSGGRPVGRTEPLGAPPRPELAVHARPQRDAVPRPLVPDDAPAARPVSRDPRATLRTGRECPSWRS